MGINFMLLLGFGFLMTVIRTNSLTALTYTLLVMALVMQLYILLFGFWSQVFSLFAKEFFVLLD